MLLEGLSQMILRVLRIPPGTSLRKQYGSGEAQTSITDNDYVQAMVDITVDDICIGEEPLTLDCDVQTPETIKEKLKQICDECNDIVKWAAKDLCIQGYSVYDASINKLNRLVLLPHNQEVEFYLTKDKKVVVYESESEKHGKKQLSDVLVFLNFDKVSLEEVEDDEFKKFAYKINPSPMQLKNATRAVTQLNNAENAVLRYRMLASRVARWVNVDVGLSQGDKQQEVVDTISSAINANSMSLTPTSEIGEFDDNIPVLPNRKGIGKPEITSDKMDVNIKELADIDYLLGKLNLCMRFPGSYVDFSKALTDTAVSTIRGDIRYSKMCKSVSTKIVKTLNEFVNESEKFRKYHPAFLMTTLPTPEDEDVIAALDQYSELAEKVYNFVIGDNEEEPKTAKLYRLQMLQDLFATSAMSPTIQSWFETLQDQIKNGIEGATPELEEGSEDLGGESLEGADEVDLGGIEMGSEEDLDEGPEPPAEVEFIEPQSE